MRLQDYYRTVLMPANAAVSALRRNGLPVDLARLDAAVSGWRAQLAELTREVEGEAAARGSALKYDPETYSAGSKALADFLYRGLGLEPRKETKTGYSTDAESLASYASIPYPQPTDNPWVFRVLKIRSLAGAIGKAEAYRTTRRSDGACHPKFNWALRTSRLSAEDPPVHQIPEHSDPEVADGIKSFMVPRVAPAPRWQDWDPRIHGSVLRWDIDGAEAAIRAANLTHRFCKRPDPAWEYIRLGKDIHAHTASLIDGKPESEYRKGMLMRDVMAKHTFFTRQFGGEWATVQASIWDHGRIRVEDEEAQRICAAFDDGHPGLVELYEIDKVNVAQRGYCEDGYGRRRWCEFPDDVQFKGWGPDGKAKWFIPKGRGGATARAWHVAANTPTQSMNATDCLWMVALCTHGEYVELRVPPMWEHLGVSHPDAAPWQLNGGRGPGGRPFQAWYSNTVHDSAWGDCAPGYLVPFAKLVHRRCRAVPFDWRLEADVPYRVSISVGPDYGHLESYAKAAKRFGLELLE